MDNSFYHFIFRSAVKFRCFPYDFWRKLFLIPVTQNCSMRLMPHLVGTGHICLRLPLGGRLRMS